MEYFNKQPRLGILSTSSKDGKGNVLNAMGRTTEADAAFAKAKELGYTS